MSLSSLLVNTVTIERRVVTPNETGEEEVTYPESGWTAGVKASVQDKAPSNLALPDVDGPVVINASIYTEFRTDVDHLDRVRQTDVSPEVTYLVVSRDDEAGRHHHTKLVCSRIETIGTGVGS